MPPRTARGPGFSSPVFTVTNGIRMATKVTPFNKNSHPGSMTWRSTAANAGPKTREPVMTAVFRAMTLEMSSSSTSSNTKPRRAGLSRAPKMPKVSDSA